jgi:hypothetical protein
MIIVAGKATDAEVEIKAEAVTAAMAGVYGLLVGARRVAVSGRS